MVGLWDRVKLERLEQMHQGKVLLTFHRVHVPQLRPKQRTPAVLI